MTLLKCNTEAELVSMLANATVTYDDCLGHSKAENNKLKIDQYKRELRARNVAIPSDEELRAMGKFNGPGSY